MEIFIEQTAWGLWIGKIQNGWEVEEVRGHDREQVLLRLLNIQQIHVTYTGTHWVGGKPVPWEVKNF